ncbi:MAG: SDR family NAD(P)-dependent oxidoreductase [Alphaproteobacteria bacterium GM202ARS2]|nr:SDR family NAD(P)-dependent oxidoreductase [Alphaproteobacteria bacterium GM202ARS2]
MKSGRVLITGGSGFLGSALVKKMLVEGWHVRVLDDNSRGAARRLVDVAADIEFIEGDVCDYDSVHRACRGVDVIAHLAYINGTAFFYSKPGRVLEVGMKGALHTLDAARAHGIERYWLMSSSEVYQHPKQVPTDEGAPLVVPDVMNPRYSYGGGKIASELLAIHYDKGLSQVVIVRPHNVYGADMGFEHVVPQMIMRAARVAEATPEGETLKFPIRGDGRHKRAFVYIDDFVEGCYLAFSKGQGRSLYHVGTGDEITVAALADKVLGLFGRKGVVVPSAAPQGETPRRCPDITKVVALGYKPQVSLDDGLARTHAWYMDNQNLWLPKT